MMDARRSSVSAVAAQLQKDGLISYRRGIVRILDIKLVQRQSCECYKAVRELYENQFGGTPTRSDPLAARERWKWRTRERTDAELFC